MPEATCELSPMTARNVGRLVAAWIGCAILLGTASDLLGPGYAQQSPSPDRPPVAPVREVVDDYFGTKVMDSYRYLENLQNPEVQAWLKAQNHYARTILHRIPGREQLLARVKELDESAPARIGGCVGIRADGSSI